MKRKAFVLLSGGIDSSTVLAMASMQFVECEGVSIDYGQRHQKEIEYAQKQCVLMGCAHHVLQAGDILRGGMLTNPLQAIPDVKYSDIEGVSPTYVPFRNGTMLSMITAHAQRWINKFIDGDEWITDEPPEAAVFIGAHAEDAHNWAYPDCTPEFLGAMANAIYIGTYRTVRLHAPIMWLEKAAVVLLGNDLGVQWEHTWSCYAGGDLHCGKCPTCYARQDAFKAAGIKDPTRYAHEREDV